MNKLVVKLVSNGLTGHSKHQNWSRNTYVLAFMIMYISKGGYNSYKILGV